MGRKPKGYVPVPDDRFLQDNGDVLQIADSMRKRQWFLTINQDAPCFKDFADRVESFGEKSNGSELKGYYHWCYILHDKDTISENGYNEMVNRALENNDISLFDRACGYVVLDDEQRTSKQYAYKPPHYHLLMCFENARSWSCVKNWFVGAHVQSCLSVGNSFRYLTHDTQECINRGKTKYDADELICSPRGLEFFQSYGYDEIRYKFFDSHKIAKYVWVDDLDNYHDFMLMFGAQQVQRWMSSINSECNVKHELMRVQAKSGEYCFRNKYCVWTNEGMQFVSDDEIKSGFRMNASSVKVLDFKSYLDKISLTEYGREYCKVILYSGYKLNPIEQYFITRDMPKVADIFEVKPPQLVFDTVDDIPTELSDRFELRLVVNG